LTASACGQPAGSKPQGAVFADLVDNASRDRIDAMAQSKAEQSGDSVVLRLAAQGLMPTQQPGPFKQMARFDRAFARTRADPPGVVENFAQCAGLRIEEPRQRKIAQIFGAAHERLFAGRFVKRQKGFEQMHMRILPSQRVGARQAVPIETMGPIGEDAVDKSQGLFNGLKKNRRFFQPQDKGQSEKRESVRVKIALSFDWASVSVGGENPPRRAIGAEVNGDHVSRRAHSKDPTEGKTPGHGRVGKN
jgi:hypothetical protein